MIKSEALRKPLGVTALCSILLLASAVPVDAGSPAANGPAPVVKPYQFEAVARRGDTVDGQQITEFMPNSGQNVEINNHGDVVFVANTTKGEAVFLFRYSAQKHRYSGKALAYTGMTLENHPIQSFGAIAIDARGRWAYVAVCGNAGTQGTIYLVRDGRPVLHTGIKIQGAPGNVWLPGFLHYDEQGKLVEATIFVTSTKKRMIGALVDEHYSASATAALKTYHFDNNGISDYHGHQIYSSFNGLKRLDGKSYPFAAGLYAINRRKQILASSISDNHSTAHEQPQILIFPYDDTQEQKTDYSMAQIPHAASALQKALGITNPNIVPNFFIDPPPAFGFTNATENNRFDSGHSVGADLSDNGNIALFVHWSGPIRADVTPEEKRLYPYGGYAPNYYALVVGNPGMSESCGGEDTTAPPSTDVDISVVKEPPLSHEGIEFDSEHPYGLTGLSTFKSFKMGAYCHNNTWHMYLTKIQGQYFEQVDESQFREVSGPPPPQGQAGTTTEANRCDQMLDISAIAKDSIAPSYYINQKPWYMYAAIKAHEDVHASHILPALENSGHAIEQEVSTLSTPYRSGDQWKSAVIRVMKTDAFKPVLADAFDKWSSNLEILWKHDHDAGGPTQTAEIGVTRPMLLRMISYSNSHHWHGCMCSMCRTIIQGADTK